jgi:bzd-type benzoyl-CoA reductase N subunit
MSAEGLITGLAAVDKYYQDYGLRARELKKQGNKIMGYLCALVPLEMISAAGYIPFRIKGDVNEPITKADTEMETIVCPLIRSCFDMSLKGKYEFLDGLIMPHACDSMCRTYDVWKYTLNLPFAHLINMPHTTSDSSLEFYQDILNTMKTSLNNITDEKISDQNLKEYIQLYNQNRAKVRELYELRKEDPPLISGAEVTKLLVASMSIPIKESTELINSVIDEVKQRPRLQDKKSARLMVVGAQLDNVAFIDLIEDSGAWVVTDDLCLGTREFFSSVDTTRDPVNALAERYLTRVCCSRTYKERKGSYQEYIIERFGHIGDYIKDYNVNGVVLYIFKYCDPYGFDVPEIKSYIESMGVQVLYLEDEYSMSTIGRLRTRIQAFLELLS